MDYEYELEGLDKFKAGGRVKKQIGDNLGIGVTYLSEDRDNKDFELVGWDVTINAGSKTELKAEHALSKAEETDRWGSNDGGLSFHLRMTNRARHIR